MLTKRQKHLSIIIGISVVIVISLLMTVAMLKREYALNGGMDVTMTEYVLMHAMAIFVLYAMLSQMWNGQDCLPPALRWHALYAVLSLVFAYGMRGILDNDPNVSAVERAVSLCAMMLLAVPQIGILYERFKVSGGATIGLLLLTIAAPTLTLVLHRESAYVPSVVSRGPAFVLTVVFIIQLAILLWTKLAGRRMQPISDLCTLLCGVGWLTVAVKPLFGGPGYLQYSGLSRHAIFLSMVLCVVYVLYVQRRDRAAMLAHVKDLHRREEEYRLVSEQSQRYLVRFDLTERTCHYRPETQAAFALPESLSGVPEANIDADRIDPHSVLAYRRFYEKMHLKQQTGSGVFGLRTKAGQTMWLHGDFTLLPDDGSHHICYLISCYELEGMQEKEDAYLRRREECARLDPNVSHWYELDLTNDKLADQGGALFTLPGDPPFLSGLNNFLAKTYLCPEDRAAYLHMTDIPRLIDQYAQDVRSEVLECRRIVGGEYAWLRVSVQLVADPYSQGIRCFLLFEDTEIQKKREAMLKKRSATDELTGLMTRSAFISTLEELCRKPEEGRRHAVIMIDMDGFKNVNDTFGHQFGDKVLTDAAGDLRAVVRADDLAARFGGDEFMLCLKDVQQDNAILERRCDAICRMLSKQFSDEVAITASLGVAIFPDNGLTFDELYRFADRGLYRAKELGGNRFAFGAVAGAGAHDAPAAAKTAEPVREESLHRRGTLLIADPDEKIRAQLCELFAPDYNVLTASTCQMAQELLVASPSTISAMLFNLGEDHSGLELLTFMSGDSYYQSIPVLILCAAEDEDGATLRAIELGAVDFIRMPFDGRLARVRVRNAIYRRETETLRAQNRELLVQRSDEARHQNQLRYMAEHDTLTQVFNKSAFLRRTRTLLRNDPDRVYCVVALDVQRFRAINDIFGHEEGDRLLRYIAAQIGNELGHSGTYGRTETDHFAICCPCNAEELETHMQHMDEAMRRYDLAFEVLLSYGIYMVEDSTMPISQMLDRAEMAKRTIKGSFVKRFAFYDDTMRDRMIDEQEIINCMNSALEHNEFAVYFQPKCRLDTGAMAAAEALVRWQHPTRGLMNPGLFIPIFEKNGFIMKLDLYMWEHVCMFLSERLRRDPDDPLRVSVNISRASLYNPVLCETLASLCETYRVPPDRMEVEITESAYMENEHLLRELIDQLHHEGFAVEMDDFGSGYSSLNVLKDLPVDVLKLDMQLLSQLEGRGGSILRSILEMAGRLQLPVIAEGVETETQARFLAGIGCQQAQGYYYARPMPAEQFGRLLNEQSAAPEKPITTMAQAAELLSGLLCGAALLTVEGGSIRLLEMNDYYLHMMRFGYAHADPVDRDLDQWIGAEDHKALLAAMQTARETAQPRSCVYLQRDLSGRHRLLRGCMRYLFDYQSLPLYMMTMEDMSRREE